MTGYGQIFGVVDDDIAVAVVLSSADCGMWEKRDAGGSVAAMRRILQADISLGPFSGVLVGDGWGLEIELWRPGGWAGSNEVYG